MKPKTWGILCAAVFVAGCANQMSVYRHTDLASEQPSLVTVDANQRFFATNYVTDEDNGVSKLRMCAEQFPDVFSVIGGSLAARTSIIPGTGGNRLDGELAAVLQQSAGTIARTQTVNLLRESMYRTCERYMSGAIDAEELSIQAARDLRTMVSVLAIEQLTGSISPPASAITVNGSSTAAGGAATLAENIQTAKTEWETASTALKEAEAEMEGVELTDDGTCPQEEGTDAGVAGSATSECATKLNVLNEAKAAEKTASEHYELVRTLAIGFTNAQFRTTAEAIEGGPTGRARSYLDEPRSIEVVAKAVTEIVRIASTSNYYHTVCETLLTSFAEDPGEYVEALEGPPGEQFRDMFRDMFRDCSRQIDRSLQELISDGASEPIEVDYILFIDPASGNDSLQELETAWQKLEYVLAELPEQFNNYGGVYETNEKRDPDFIVEYYSEEDLGYAQTLARAIARYAKTTPCIRIAGEVPGDAAGEINVFLPAGFDVDTTPKTPSTSNIKFCQ